MRVGLLGSAVAVVLVAGLPAQADGPPPIEKGFHLLYETRFEESRSWFVDWQKKNPQDALGHAWEAASYLFEEFYQQGVLSSQFFLDDKNLFGGGKVKPNRASGIAFVSACTAAERLAKQRLAANPRDADALLALTVTAGMRADYASLIEKRPLESLKRIRESESYAKTLLAVKPDAADAYLALGAGNYIIGSLPAHERFFLWLGGIQGNRELGMEQLERAATHGDYLRPFAKILLALAALRERQPRLARAQLEDLAAEFPHNPLFARELAIQRNSTPGQAAR